MRAPLLRLLRNSSTSGSPGAVELVLKGSPCSCNARNRGAVVRRFVPTRVSKRARRGTGQQASPRRGAFSGLKNNSATAPSSPPGASPPLRCVGDCCFRKTLSQLGQSAAPLAPSAASIVPATAARQHRAVVALLPASDPTCRRTPPVATAAWQHLGSIWAASGQPLPLRAS